MVNEIDTSKFGIVVVDMQSNFLRWIEKSRRRNLISTQKALLDVCAQRDIPVVVFEYRGEGETIFGLKEKIKRIPRKKLFRKEYDDGFLYNHELINQINLWGLEYICMTGVNADSCVKETAIGARSKKYRVLTSEDLISDDTGDFGISSARKWFLENGAYYQTYSELLNSLK